MAVEFIRGLIVTSLTGTALALLIMCMKPITKRIFSYSWNYYIWLAVLLCMVLPIRIELPEREPARMTVISDIPTEAVFDGNVQKVADKQLVTSEQKETDVKSGRVERKADGIKSAVRFASASMLMNIWVFGALFMMMVNMLGYVRLLRSVQKNSVIAECPETYSYTNRKIKVRRFTGAVSPFIMGVVRPTLVIPDTDLTPVQLDNILRHEMMHLRRNDILYKWFVQLVKCIHWFNPMIYLVSRQINLECEISCDLAVVGSMSHDEEMGYIDTIIALLSKGTCRKSLSFTTGMSDSKKSLKRRFNMIKNRFNVSRKMAVLSLALALVLLVAAIAAGGIINGRASGLYENQTIELKMDPRENEYFNALILGVDEEGRADTAILVMAAERHITAVSIPRDTAFDGRKLSAIPLEENGNQRVVDAVRRELSVPVTYYAKVKLDIVKDLVDASGGLTMDVPMDMKYDDPEKNLHIDLKKGEAQKLDGEAVCGLLRFRRSNTGTGYQRGDMERIEMGQRVVEAFLEQNKGIDIIADSKKIIEGINKNIETNYPLKNYIKDRKLFKDSEISLVTVPGTVVVENSIMQYRIDRGEWDSIVKKQRLNQGSLLASSDSILSDMESPVKNGKISRGFDEENGHCGVDIAAAEGDAVYSAISGVVADTGFDSEIGNYVVVESGDLSVLYGHMEEAGVTKDEKIKKGAVIGAVGRTGQATGTILHFEVKSGGKYVNPEGLF